MTLSTFRKAVIAIAIAMCAHAATAGAMTSGDSLAAQIQPDPSGDRFLDEMPKNLDAMRNGNVTATRDVTGSAAILVGAPVGKVIQMKFRTTDATGHPSFGTATAILPPGDITGRPVLVNNLAIDSLGRRCASGYAFAHGISSQIRISDYLPPVTYSAARKGYVVLIPDHEGPKMAYAEPFTAGHIVLDSIRALRSVTPVLAQSRYAMTGYSGGAIATNGAAKLVDRYAPELRTVLVGAALGGTPIDDRVLVGSMADSPLNWAKGLFVAAVYGIAREHPEILGMINGLAARVAPVLRNSCSTPLTLLGLLPLRVEWLSNIPDPFSSALARRIFTESAMGDIRYGMPLYVYNGAQEFWIPTVMARRLYDEQCRLGVASVFRQVPGEHAIGSFTGFPDATRWLDRRLGGVPAPNECRR